MDGLCCMLMISHCGCAMRGREGPAAGARLAVSQIRQTSTQYGDSTGRQETWR